jgi:hypothetical protein
MNRLEIISRLRNSIKEVHADSEYSNRYLWNTVLSSAKRLIKEDADRGRIFRQSTVWDTICVEMEEVSSVYCNCFCLPYNSTVYRSKRKLPEFVEASNGLIYRFIATPDLSKEFTLVSPYQFALKSKIKYNREKYAFIHDGYLYTPNSSYPLLSVSSLFLDDISDFKCDQNGPVGDGDAAVSCPTVLDLSVPLPDYMEEACIKMALQELGFSKQIASDQHPNANENQKEVSP